MYVCAMLSSLFSFVVLAINDVAVLSWVVVVPKLQNDRLTAATADYDDDILAEYHHLHSLLPYLPPLHDQSSSDL